MKIVRDYPPLFDEIDARFHVRGKPFIYAWGDTIYNPTGIDVPGQLVAHERVHGRQQGSDIEGWWRHYIDDDQFRTMEEALAHLAEYEYLLASAANRGQRRSALKATAKRLANPAYRTGLTRNRAALLLKRGVKAMAA